MTELTATVVIKSLLRATADDATPIIRRLARNQARVFLDSRAGDAFDIPEYAPDDISHLEGLASYLDGVARDKGRAGLPASKSLFEEIAKRLREYDVIRNRGRAGDAGEGLPDRLSDEERQRASDMLDLIAPLSVSSTWEPSERRTIIRAMLAYGDIVAAMVNSARDATTPAPAVDAVPAGEVAEQAHAAVRSGDYRMGYLRMCEAYGKLAALSHGEGRK